MPLTKTQEEKLPENERETARQSFERQCISYNGFKLVKGFVSARAQGTKEQLIELARNPNIFVVIPIGNNKFFVFFWLSVELLFHLPCGIKRC